MANRIRATRLKIGLLAGLASVAFTTVVNIVGSRTGILPKSLDLRQLGEFLTPAGHDSLTIFAGVAVHILAGTMLGGGYSAVMKNFNIRGALVFVTGVWLVLMVIGFPLTQRGVFGLRVGVELPIWTFLLHQLYGLGLGLVAKKLDAAPDGAR